MLSRMIISRGMEETPNEAASSCCASVSTLPNTASGFASDALSKIGPNMRQGPHHSAQKSTSARSAPPITDSKFSAVSSTVAIDASSASKRYPLGYPAGYTNQGGPWTIPNRGRPQAIPARPGPARPCPGEWGHPGPRADVPDRAVVAARRPSGPSPLCRPVAGYRLEQDGGDDHVVSRPVRRWQATGPA